MSAVVLLFGITGIALAQNELVKPTPVRDVIKVNTTEAIKVEKRYNKIINRFQATIERLENIITRMETRIAKIKSESVTAKAPDTTVAEKAIADAKKFIADAKLLMATMKIHSDGADNTYANASTTKEFKGHFADLQKITKSTKKLLNQAHTSLTKAIGSLKGLRVGDKATTTERTTN